MNDSQDLMSAHVSLLRRSEERKGPSPEMNSRRCFEFSFVVLEGCSIPSIFTTSIDVCINAYKTSY